MITMYPGKVNSPIAELAADITASADTITITNGDVLPDAPNLATIGRGDIAETVRYAAKVGNVINGVERGFNGTVARAWAATTDIARYFTEYDYAALTGNVAEISGNTAAVMGALDTHEASTIAHGATSEAVGQRIVSRDAGGQFKVGAPSDPAHVARKQDLPEVPQFATQAQAEAGTDNASLMTPLRTNQAIQKLVPKPEVIWRINPTSNLPEWSNDSGGSWNNVGDRFLEMTPNIINYYQTASSPIGAKSTVDLFSYEGDGILGKVNITIPRGSPSFGIEIVVDGAIFEFYKSHNTTCYTPLFSGNNQYGASSDLRAVILNSEIDFKFKSSFKIRIRNIGSAETSFGDVSIRGVYYT